MDYNTIYTPDFKDPSLEKPMDWKEFWVGAAVTTGGLLAGGAVVLSLLASFTPVGDKLGMVGTWIQNHQDAVITLEIVIGGTAAVGIVYGTFKVLVSLPRNTQDDKLDSKSEKLKVEDVFNDGGDTQKRLCANFTKSSFKKTSWKLKKTLTIADDEIQPIEKFGEHTKFINIDYQVKKDAKYRSSEYRYKIFQKAETNELWIRFFQITPVSVEVFRNAEQTLIHIQVNGPTKETVFAISNIERRFLEQDPEVDNKNKILDVPLWK